MKLERDAVLLRLFLGESDRHDGMALYRWIVRKARRDGLAGATVLRGIEGFGAHSRLHTTSILRLSEDLPIVVEIVDTEDRIERFLADLDGVITEGLATLEKAHVRIYRAGPEDSPAGGTDEQDP
ncbi:MAG: DUF190 domain-containing protein [Acidobacteriota bacterium]|nr:MAG: DUF190 domain-containing protein [Acidobacteriota bacterium]